MIIIIYSNNVQLCVKNQITICTFETWHLSIFTCVLRNIKMKVSAEKPKICDIFYMLFDINITNINIQFLLNNN